MTSKTIIVLGVIYHELVVCTQPCLNSAIIMGAKIQREIASIPNLHNFRGGRFLILSLLYLNGGRSQAGIVIAVVDRRAVL